MEGYSPRLIDLSNRIFGYLTVIRLHHIDPKWQEAIWECLCKCGKIKITRSNNLIGGKSISCGCKPKHQLKEKGEAGLNYVFGKYKRSALKRKLDFFLSKVEFRYIIISNCFYCEIEPNQKAIYGGNHSDEGLEYAQLLYNGIDRLDNKKGYILGNVVPCCQICNYAKRNLSVEEFYIWINRVHRNFDYLKILDKKGKIYE